MAHAASFSLIPVGNEQVSVSINWPVQIGSMADVCVPQHDQDVVRSLVCHRGSVTDLCEVSMHRPNSNNQGVCTICCSARTCEIYEQKDSDSTSYVATTRGKPAGDLFEHSLNLPAARKIILRMLSLAQSGILRLHHIRLAPASETELQNKAPADQVSGLHHRPSRPSQSQQAEVQAMLQQLMSSGPPGSATGPADTHQKFMAALAKAALAQNKGQLADKQQQDFIHSAPAPSQSATDQSAAGLPAAHQSAADPPAMLDPQQQQLQSQSPLIQDITEAGTPTQVDAALHDGQQRQAAGQAHAHTDQQHREGKRSEQDHMRQFDERLQALEASSRRTERKVDQILQYCRTLAQAMSPA